MKKITSLLLIMVMLLSLAVPAFAGENETLNDRLLELTQDGTIEIDGGTIFWREFYDLNKTIKLFEDVIRYYENEGTNTDNVQLILNALAEYKNETGLNTVKYYDIRDGKLITDINKAEAYLVVEIKDNNKEIKEKHFNDSESLFDFVYEVYTQAHEGWMIGDTITEVNGIVMRNFIMGTDPKKEFPITEAYGINQDVVIQEGMPSATNPEVNNGKGFFLHINPTPSELMNASNMSFIIQNQTGIDFKTVDSGEFYIGINTIGKDTSDEFVLKVIYNVDAVEIDDEDVPESQIEIVEDVIEMIPKAKPPVEMPVTETSKTETEASTETKSVEKSEDPVVSIPDEQTPDNPVTPEPQPEDDPFNPVVPVVVVALAGMSIFTVIYFKKDEVAVYLRSEDVAEDEILLGKYKVKNKDDLRVDLTDTLDLLADKKLLVVKVSKEIKDKMFGNEIIIMVDEAEKTVKLNAVDLGDKTVYEAVISKKELLG